MNKIEVIALAVRFFGIFLLITIIRDSSAFIFSIVSFGEKSDLWLIISSLVIVIFIICTLILIKFPLLVAGKLIPKSITKEQVITFSKDDIEYVGFTIIGMFMIVRAIPDMFYWLSFLYQSKTAIDPPMIVTGSEIISTVATALEIIIGLLVLFGAKGLQNIISKVKMLGAK